MPNSLKKHDVYVPKDGLAKHDFCVLVNGKLVKHDVHVVSKESGEPIAYSYNGVVLPSLPDAVQNYPSAVMFRDTHENYYVALSNGVPTLTGNALNMNGSGSYYTPLSSGKWICIEDHTNKENYGFDGSYFSRITIFWTNCDIFDTTTNTLFLKASEPIPIYE